jgi:hypothetical protein
MLSVAQLSQLEIDLRLCKTKLCATEASLAFYDAVATAEVERGAGLWAKKQEYQVWRMKTHLDRVAREECMVALTTDLDTYGRKMELATQLPRQAMNTVEKAQLLIQSEEEVASFRQKLERTLEHLQDQRKAHAHLVQLELFAMEYHKRRLAEEKILMDEARTLWAQHDAALGAAEAVSQDLASSPTNDNANQQDQTASTSSSSSSSVALYRTFLLLCYAREKRWRAIAAFENVDVSPWLEQEQWLLSQQQQRHDIEIKSLNATYQMQITQMKLEMEQLQIQLTMALQHTSQVEAAKDALQQIYARVSFSYVGRCMIRRIYLSIYLYMYVCRWIVWLKLQRPIQLALSSEKSKR